MPRSFLGQLQYSARLRSALQGMLSTAFRCFASNDTTHLSSRAQYHDRILRCAKAGDAERASSWFSKMRAAGYEPDLQAYNFLLGAHASRGDMDSADEVLSSMQQDYCVPDQFTFFHAIQSCERSGDIQHAQAHFQNMQQMGILLTDLVCNAMIAVQASVGDVEGVERTLKEMRRQGVPPDRVSFNSALAAAVKAADQDAVTRWLNEMKQSGFEPDATTYTTVVNSSVLKRNMLEAEKWIDQAIQDQILSPAPFNCLIGGYGKVGDLSAAEAVIDRMRPIIQWLHHGGRMLKPDVITYTSLISGFAARGQMQLAKEWLDNMCQVSLEPTAATFGTILRSCEKRHDVDAAEHIRKKMEELEIEPNRVIFNTLLHIYASARDINQAEAVFQDLVSRNTPDIVAFGSLVKAAARIPDLARSEAWMMRARSAGLILDARIFYSLLSGAASVGDLAAAQQTIDDMKAVGLAEDVVTCTALIRACAIAGDLEEAEVTLERMESHGILPNVYTLNATMTACARARSPTRAEHWFRQLVKKGVKMDIIGFNSLMAAWMCDPARIEYWIQRMRIAAISPDIMTFNGLLNSCAIVCDVDLAKEVWSHLDQAGIRPTLASYRSYSKALARQGLYQELSSLQWRMAREGRSKDKFCLRALLTACAKAKPEDAAKAAKVAEKVFQDAHKMFANDSYARRALRLAMGAKASRRYKELTNQFNLDPPRIRTPQEDYNSDVKQETNATHDEEAFMLLSRNASAQFVLESRQSMPQGGRNLRAVQAATGQAFVCIVRNYRALASKLSTQCPQAASDHQAALEALSLPSPRQSQEELAFNTSRARLNEIPWIGFRASEQTCNVRSCGWGDDVELKTTCNRRFETMQMKADDTVVTRCYNAAGFEEQLAFRCCWLLR
eukprot:s2625_g10.t2